MTAVAPRIPSSSGPGNQPSLEAPRTRATGAAGRNTELWIWLFQRISGLVLVVLVLGHVMIMLTLDGGVQRINFGFVAGRWSSPFWQTWDLAQLWLAQLHGAVGLRVIIGDYATRDQTRFWLKMLLYVATTFTILLGTLVILTFDPTIS